MRSTSTPATRATARAKWLLAAFTLLIFVPNCALIYSYPHLVWWVRGLLVTGLLYATLFAALRRWPALACLVLLPSAALAPAETYFILRYARPSDANLIGVLMDSNLREAAEYLAGVYVPLLLSLLAAAALGLCTVVAVHRAGLRWRHRSAHWVLAIALGVPLASMALAAYGCRAPGRHWEAALARLDQLRAETEAYPFDLVQRWLDYRREWPDAQAALQRQATFRFGAQAAPAPARRIFVLVLGESSRRDHWSLYGYARATTPELAALPNLVPLSDMISPWTQTRDAVPVIVSRKPAADPQGYFAEPSVERLFAEAGFDTAWFTTQIAVGPYDSPVSTAAFQAAHVKFLNPVGFVGDAAVDGDLVAPLHAAIAGGGGGDLFVVLHTLGSHEAYRNRVPHGFAPFSAPRAADWRQQMTNEYDDTIRYTDHVLTAVIAELADSGAITALFYVSDHGEALPQGKCELHGHGIVPALPTFQVPAFFWYSDAYAATHADKIARLRTNAARQVSTDSVFESLADMADIEFPSHDPHRSLFATQLAPGVRFVHDGNVRFDWENKQVGGACEVVEPGPAAPPARPALSSSPN